MALPTPNEQAGHRRIGSTPLPLVTRTEALESDVAEAEQGLSTLEQDLETVGVAAGLRTQHDYSATFAVALGGTVYIPAGFLNDEIVDDGPVTLTANNTIQFDEPGLYHVRVVFELSGIGGATHGSVGFTEVGGVLSLSSGFLPSGYAGKVNQWDSIIAVGTVRIDASCVGAGHGIRPYVFLFGAGAVAEVDLVILQVEKIAD